MTWKGVKRTLISKIDGKDLTHEFPWTILKFFLQAQCVHLGYVLGFSVLEEHPRMEQDAVKEKEWTEASS